jgi:BirA family biotin operon repressor/biotin-[acetyl-CoA-carboxylase] ligase
MHYLANLMAYLRPSRSLKKPLRFAARSPVNSKALWDFEPSDQFNFGRLATNSIVRGLVHRRQLDSTNNLALELSSTCADSMPLLVIADHQTAGRGRGSHAWWSSTGSLTFSLVLDTPTLDLRVDHWPRVALAAAVAVCDLLSTIVPQAPCGIRWPNDVELTGFKICGVLPEPAPVPNRLVLGVGVNVNNSMSAAPVSIRNRSTSVIDQIQDPRDLTEFLELLLRGLFQRLEELAQGNSRLCRSWQRLCLLRGRMVELQVGPRSVRGLCLGTQPDGTLKLETAVGPEFVRGGTLVSVE